MTTESEEVAGGQSSIARALEAIQGRAAGKRERRTAQAGHEEPVADLEGRATRPPVEGRRTKWADFLYGQTERALACVIVWEWHEKVLRDTRNDLSKSLRKIELPKHHIDLAQSHCDDASNVFEDASARVDAAGSPFGSGYVELADELAAEGAVPKDWRKGKRICLRN